MSGVEVTPGIYSITSKVNQRIYIGSSVSCWRRWNQHKASLRRGDHPNSHLQAHANKYGIEDLVFAIEEVEPDLTLRLGVEQLMVTALVGEGCFNLSLDVWAFMTGRKFTPEHKAKISAGLTGRTVSPETGAKISKAKKGTIASPETRARMSAVRTGKPGTPRTPEAKERLRVVNLGRHPTLETRAKMSAAGKGRVHTPEHREKVRQSKLGRTIPAEVRAKISATKKRKAAGG